MATLNNNDFQDIKKIIRRDPTARAEFKAWGLEKATWKATFQAAEDWFVDGFSVSLVAFCRIIDPSVWDA